MAGIPLAEAFVRVGLDDTEVPAQAKAAGTRAGTSFGTSFHSSSSTGTTKTGTSLGTTLAPAGAKAGSSAGKSFGSSFDTDVRSGTTKTGTTLGTTLAPAGTKAGTAAGKTFGSAFDTDVQAGTTKAGQGIVSGTGTAGTRAGTTAGKNFGSSFGGSLKGLALGAGALVGFSAVKNVLGDMNAEARESQKVTALTAAVIKSTGGVANVSADDIGNLSEAISMKIGVDDEAIQSGANMLLTFSNVRNEVGKGNDIFDQATVTVQDMAAAFGGDAVSNSKILGKALNDPIKGVSALTRVGVSFTDQQKDQIAALVETGDTMGAQKVILGELAKQTRGAALSQASAGDKATVAWQNLQETLGLKLLPVVDDVLNGFVKVVGSLDDISAGVQATIGVFDNLPGPVKNTALALGAVALAQRALGTARAQGWVTSMSTGLATVRTQATLSATAIRSIGARTAALKGAAGIAGIALSMADLGDESSTAGKAVGFLGSAASGGLLGFAAGGPIGAALGVGVSLLSNLAGGSDEAAEAQARLEEAASALVATLNKQTGRVTAQSLESIASALQDIGTFDVADQLGVDLNLVTRAASGSKKSLNQLNRELDAMAAAVKPGGPADLANLRAGGAGTAETYRELTGLIAKLRGGVGQQSGVVADARGKWDQNNRAMDDAAATTGRLGDKTSKTTRAFADQTDEVKDTKDELVGYRSVVVSLIDRQIGLSQAIIDARNALKDNADGFNRNTQAGIDNYNVILDLARATEGFTGKTERGEKAIEAARSAIIDYAAAQGKTIPQAETLANRLLGVANAGQKVNDQPANMKVTADTSKANTAVDTFQRNFKVMRDGITGKTISFEMTSQAAKIADQIGVNIGGIQKYAAGGEVPGWIGTRGKDSVRALLMPDEHVVTTAEVRAAGGGDPRRGHRVIEGMRRSLLAGALEGLPQGYAAGGPVFDVRGKQSGIADTGRLLRSVFDTISQGLSDALSKKGSEYLRQQAVPAGRVLRGPNGQVMMDGWPLTATHAAQIILSERLAGFNQTVMQGSWQPATSYSGTSHGGPGVADSSPGNFSAQNVQRKVGIAAWGRNFPGAATAGSGAHIHGVSLLDPGTAGNSQAASYRAGGDGLGGSDYGPRPSMIPGLLDQVATIRANMFDAGGILKANQIGLNRSGKPEAVLDPEETKAYKRLAAAIAAFKPGRNDSVRDVRTDLRDLYQAIRENLGKNSPLFDAAHKMGDKTIEAAQQFHADTREAAAEARADAKERSKQERVLSRSLNHLDVGVRQNAGAVHDQAADLIKQLRAIFGKDAPIVDRMADLGTKMVQAARERDQVAKQLTEAVSGLRELRSARNELVSSTTSSFTADVFGAAGAQTTQGMRAYLRDQIAQTTAFGDAEQKLVDKGLSQPLIRQLVGNGPDALAKAQALAGLSRKELAKFNKLAAEQAAQAARIGTIAGDALYADGIKAAEGVVAGLRKHRAQITRELERLANRAVRAVLHRIGDIDDVGGDRAKERRRRKEREDREERSRRDGGRGRSGPIVHIEHQHVRDERAAGREIERRQREALAIMGGD